jgi:hypothetical protein
MTRRRVTYLSHDDFNNMEEGDLSSRGDDFNNMARNQEDAKQIVGTAVVVQQQGQQEGESAMSTSRLIQQPSLLFRHRPIASHISRIAGSEKKQLACVGGETQNLS